MSDGLPLAGMGDGRATLGGVAVVMRGGRCTLEGSETLAGSVIALDTRGAEPRRRGHAAARRPSPRRRRTPPACSMPATADGIEPGRRAHLVELDDDLRVRRVTRGAGWVEGAG